METRAARAKREEKEQKLADEQAAYEEQREEARKKAEAERIEEEKKAKKFDRGSEPSIGRIVAYRNKFDSVPPRRLLKQGEAPRDLTPEDERKGPKPSKDESQYGPYSLEEWDKILEKQDYNLSPAIIQRVNEDGTITLFVFGSTGYLIVQRAVQGVEPEQWNWPKKV